MAAEQNSQFGKPEEGKVPKQFRYDADSKAKIVDAVKTARKEGKKAAEVFEAAKDAGYRGGAAALKKMIYNDKAFAGIKRRRRRGRKAARVGKAAAVQSSGAPMRRGRPRKFASAGGLPEIEAIIQREVASRVRAAIEAAVVALSSAKM